jgi:hypothetical protein
MILGAIIVAVIVAGVLVYWFVFQWNATPKRWCVMFYLTSKIPASAASAAANRPDAETGVPPAATLDQKLDQVVNVIRSLPCATAAGIWGDKDWDDVYVAYRAIWDDVTHLPEARVVRPELSAPTATYFPGETIFDVGYAIDMTKDLTAFFEWAYDNCPAQKYAVFFWGHAMGPAGLFEASEPPVVVSPLKQLLLKLVFYLTGSRWSGALGVGSVSDALGAIVQQRYKDNPTLPPLTNVIRVPPTGSGSGAGSSGVTPVDPTAPVVFEPGQTVPKVEVALFQDCWMSTLETAFELQDDVQYIISSQSLVPVGFDAADQVGAVWPYETLISTLLKQENFAGPMMTALKNFFDGVGLPAGVPPDYNRYPAKKVLWSLMDCGATVAAVSAAMQAEWQTLVQALYFLGPKGRSALIEQSPVNACRLYELEGANIGVGDEALIDVLAFCAYLQTPAKWSTGVGGTSQQRTAITTAAGDLQKKMQALVQQTFQSPPLAAGDPIYTGVAALYKPFQIWGNDPYIMAAYRSSYEKLRFSKDTLVTPAPGATECSWTEYAFDQYDWV